MKTRKLLTGILLSAFVVGIYPVWLWHDREAENFNGIYGNEEGVGRGIQKAIDERIITREEVFVTTKMWNI